VPSSGANKPFFATNLDLAARGYVEEEFYVEGNAFTYSGTTGLNTATRITTGGPSGNGSYPYRTRIVVRRPANAADFNGTTVLEWNNVTAGFDVEWNWFNDPEYYISKGYAWVGVSAQRVGVNFLRTYNPARYGTLDVTSTTSPATGDLLSFDIFGSVAKAIRGAGTGVDPMGGLSTQRLIASGESQSGGRLNSYYNTIQPLHDIVDSFLITVAGGLLRTDRPQTKAIRILSEREALTPNAADVDTSAYRRWEVAGSSHLPFMAYVNFAPVAATFVPGAATADCVRRPLSRVAWPYVHNRALDALVRWQRDGTLPANGPRMTYSGTTLVRDPQFGLAQGGIRLPEIEVPVAVNTGVNQTAPGGTGFSLFCPLLGSSEPFAIDTLNSLYSDYGDYVDKVAPKAQTVANQGFVNQDDVERLNADAARFTRLRPSTPALATGSASPTTGPFGLRWRGPAPAETATTYELQRRSSASGADWETTDATLAARERTFGADAPEGTFSFRVRSTTNVPALYPDPARVETTGFSETLSGVKVDRTGPNAPIASADRAPDFSGGGGWYRDTVTVSFASDGDRDLPDGSAGSGVDEATLTAPRVIDTSGPATASGTVEDVLGNVSPAGSLDVQVDATAPGLSLTCPAAVLLNAPASASFTASDAHSGLASPASGTVAIATNTVGPKTTTVTATDNVGKTTTRTCTTQVQYLYGGLQQPVNADDSSVFRLGSTVPLRFRLTANGAAPVSGAIARVELQKVSAVPEGILEAVSTSAATTGNLFRETAPGEYMFNLATRGLTTGTWSVRVVLDDGTVYVTKIGLR
jgi:hypothetical protein